MHTITVHTTEGTSTDFKVDFELEFTKVYESLGSGEATTTSTFVYRKPDQYGRYKSPEDQSVKRFRPKDHCRYCKVDFMSTYLLHVKALYPRKDIVGDILTSNTKEVLYDKKVISLYLKGLCETCIDMQLLLPTEDFMQLVENSCLKVYMQREINFINYKEPTLT